MSESAPSVRFEPCADYRKDTASPWACCAACGWLEDDHREGLAVVATLPLHPVVERQAS